MKDTYFKAPAVSVSPVKATDPNMKFLAQVADSDEDDHTSTGLSAADALELMINKRSRKAVWQDHIYAMETVKRSILGSLAWPLTSLQ